MNWQELITGLIVVGAAAELGRRAWLWAVGSSSSGCGSCSHCPTSSSSPAVQRVSLDMDLGGHQSPTSTQRR